MAEIKRLLTETLLANRLNISTKEIRGMVQRKEIPFVKLPTGQIRFDTTAVEQWIQRHAIPTGQRETSIQLFTERHNAMTTETLKPRLAKAKADLERIKAELPSDTPELVVDVAAAEIHILGRIGPSKNGGVSAAKFAEALKSMGGKDFTLFINSGGGEVGNGFGIGNQIERYAGKITGVVDGVAGSVASFILCCCDVRLISGASVVMIHNAWSDFAGNAEAMRKEAEILAKFSRSIHAKYVAVTGQSSDQISRWMAEETWFFGDEAITAGFCSGYFGKPAGYRPRLAAARRACVRLKVDAMRDETGAIFAAYGMD